MQSRQIRKLILINFLNSLLLNLYLCHLFEK